MKTVHLGIAAALVATLGCAAPVRVVQVESLDTETRGVRYMLTRPSYGVGLRYLDPGKDAAGKRKPEECRFQLLVVTKMDGRRYYEVRRPDWWALPLHALSNTTVSIVLDDNGALTSAKLKEEDQALEFVQAVAELAVKAAVGPEVAPPTTPAECLPEPTRAAMEGYLKGKKGLEDELAALQYARKAVLGGLARVEPRRQASALAGLAALDQRIKAASGRLAANHLPVDPANYRLQLGERVIAGSGGAQAPIQVKLRPAQLIPREESP